MSEDTPIRGHARIETSNFLMIVLILLVIAVGGLVEIVPLFFQKSTTEAVQGVEPLTPLQLAHVDVAAGDLQRRAGLQPRDRFGRRLLEEQGHDLHQAADGDDQQDQHDHQEVVGFDLLVREAGLAVLVLAHGVLFQAAWGVGTATWTDRPCATVIQVFQAMTSMPPRYSTPPSTRTT